MSVNITARYKTVARFEAMTMAALPTGATVKSVQDRRGRLVLQCEWPRSELSTADRGQWGDVEHLLDRHCCATIGGADAFWALA